MNNVSQLSPDRISELGFGQTKSTSSPLGDIFYLASPMSEWRFNTLLAKEPETIKWIDGFSPSETLWDVGANIGIYSIYAAMRGIKVLAFEPHFANYFQLCTNIMLNGLQDRITAFCLALCDQKRIDTINLSHLTFGSALSTFGGELDYRGRPYDIAFRQGMIGYDIDSLVTEFELPPPDHIKIDVDGLELQIAQGAVKTLSNPNLRSVSIELVDSEPIQVEGVAKIMANCGLKFIKKVQAPEFNNEQTNDILNFLYHRS